MGFRGKGCGEREVMGCSVFGGVTPGKLCDNLCLYASFIIYFWLNSFSLIVAFKVFLEKNNNLYAFCTRVLAPICCLNQFSLAVVFKVFIQRKKRKFKCLYTSFSTYFWLNSFSLIVAFKYFRRKILA